MSTSIVFDYKAIAAKMHKATTGVCSECEDCGWLVICNRSILNPPIFEVCGKCLNPDNLPSP